MNPSRRAVLSAGALVAFAGCSSTGSDTDGADDTEEPAGGSGDEDPAERRTSDHGAEPPVLGDPDADVTMEVYEDFTCPGCQQFKAQIFPEIEFRYLDPGEIRYEHRDFPFGGDRAHEVANSAREVFETEGSEAFFAYAAAVYDHQGEYDLSTYESVADDLGFDGAAVREAAAERLHQDAIDEDRLRADDFDVSGTPQLVVNGRLYRFGDGVGPMELIESAIEDASE